jgi:hypothetical protein
MPPEPEDILNSSPGPTSRYLERAKTIPSFFSIARNNRLSVESTGDEADDDCAFNLPAFKAGVCMDGQNQNKNKASGKFAAVPFERSGRPVQAGDNRDVWPLSMEL